MSPTSDAFVSDLTIFNALCPGCNHQRRVAFELTRAARACVSASRIGDAHRLCLACCELSLRRSLRLDDFTAAPANEGIRKGYELAWRELAANPTMAADIAEAVKIIAENTRT